MRSEQQERGCHLACSARNQCGQAFSLGAIANLVVILNTDNIRGQRNVLRAGPAWAIPEAKSLALKHVTFPQGLGNLLRIAEILVVPLTLAREEGVDGMVEVVTPHSIK